MQLVIEPLIPPSRRPCQLAALCVAIGGAVIAALCWGGFPLGVPGEWTWDWRLPAADFPLSLIPLAVAAGAFGGLVWLGSRRISACRKGEAGGWLILLAAAGFGWLWVVQETAMPPFRLGKAAWVLYYPGSSGYFTEARYNVRDVPQFLSEYEERMSQGDVLHIGTHPPGLIVGYRGLMALCARFPRLTSLLPQTEPASARESFEMVKQNTLHSPRRLREADEAVLWLAALLIQGAAAVTVIPLYGLLRRDYSPLTSWLSVSFWPLVPALALFLPKSDALFPCLGILFLYCWLEGWSKASRSLCLLAGVVLWGGLFLSLALLPVALLAAIVTAWEGWICESTERVPQAARRLLTGKIWGAIGFFVPMLMLWLTTGLNLIAVWSWNYRNHAGFYSQFPRTYWKWLLVNPLELTVAAGVPLTVLALLGCRKLLRNPWSRCAGPFWGCALTWGCLLLSGKNMGEAARLWIVLMPWLVWLAASLLRDDSPEGNLLGKVRSKLRARWAVAWCVQLAVAITVAVRIVGFHVP